MSSKSKTISKLVESRSNRESYIRAKLNHLLPSQIKALRLKNVWTQNQLGEHADMKQARISAVEKPGEVAFALDTLIRLAAAFRVGLQVRFVPFSQMVDWENKYSQDRFEVADIENDFRFIGRADDQEDAPHEQFASGIDDEALSLVNMPEGPIANQDFGKQDLGQGNHMMMGAAR